jgi:CubicO group peptidase (beta-lactamase class C family)
MFGSYRSPRLFVRSLASCSWRFGSCVALGLSIGIALGLAAPPPSNPSTAPTPMAPASILSDEALAAASAYSEAHGGRVMLVLEAASSGGRGGGVQRYERAIQGWSVDRPHPLASGTKSFSGVVAMAAIEDGLITSLDERVADTLIEWKDDPRKSAITVRHLLTLASGLQPNHASLGRQGFGIEGIAEGAGRDGPIARRLRERASSEKPADRFAASVGVPAERAPGTAFRYGPTHFYAFGEFLERKLRAANRPERSFFEYLDARVLRRAGIEVGLDRFAPDAGRKPGLPGAGHLSAREWSRFGIAMLQDAAPAGALAEGGPRVLRPESVAACMTPSATNPAYGLTWWLFTGQSNETIDIAESGGIGVDPNAPRLGSPEERPAVESVRDAHGKPVRIWMAAGAGGQRLYLLPDHDLVIVRFGSLGRTGRDYDDVTFLRTLLGLTAP